MFEHVGRPQYPAYFRRVHDLLKPDGTALIHSIGRLSPPGTGNAWIRKYIFPGGYIPAASEALAALEPSDLLLHELGRAHVCTPGPHAHPVCRLLLEKNTHAIPPLTPT